MSDWDEYASSWDDNKSVQEYSDNAFQSLTGVIDTSSVSSVLDFGCGTGQLTDKFAPLCNRIVAVDPSKAMVEVLRAKGHSNVTTVDDYLTNELVSNNKCFEEKFDLNFTLLSDPDHAIADKYGSWGPKKFMGKEYDGILRQTFIISKAGKLIHIIEKVKTKTHHEEVLGFIREHLK